MSLSPKQMEFILGSTAKWNIAHGSVRTGKTVAVTFRFLEAASQCPDGQIYIVGHTFDTAYRNVIRPILESRELVVFRDQCSWSGKKLYFRDKIITVLGAKDEGAVGNFQGLTMALVYCDEMTLYPDTIIDMIDSRLSLPHSLGFATCNPSHPEHKIKKWIDMAEEGNPRYYALHWTLDDNPYVDQDYKERLRNSTSGLFYKRNYLGLWCMGEGAIFDFFDPKIHVVSRPPRAAEYYIAGIDYGISNAFACVVVGVYTGRYTQEGKHLWAEAEYYWDCKKQGRMKINSEFAEDMVRFLEPYGVRQLYIDPSALAMKEELRRRHFPVIQETNNDVLDGIEKMTTMMGRGDFTVMKSCPNLIREIQNYIWDRKKAEKGEDAPVKKGDHACLVGSTRVLMENGDLVSLQDIYEREYCGLLLNFYEEEGTIESDFFFNGQLTREEAEIYDLELENGVILSGTGDHQVLTQRGWIPLSKLMLCDIIMVCHTNSTTEGNST